jgi:hypothetical protein
MAWLITPMIAFRGSLAGNGLITSVFSNRRTLDFDLTGSFNANGTIAIENQVFSVQLYVTVLLHNDLGCAAFQCD